VRERGDIYSLSLYLLRHFEWLLPPPPFISPLILSHFVYLEVKITICKIMFIFLVIISKGSSNSLSLIFVISLFLREWAETSASRIDLFRWFLYFLNRRNQILISDCFFIRRRFSICLPYQSLLVSLLWATTLLLFR